MNTLKKLVFFLFSLPTLAALPNYGVPGYFYSYHNGTREICHMNFYSEDESIHGMEVTLRTREGETFKFENIRSGSRSSGLGISEGTLMLGKQDGYEYFLKYHIKDGIANYNLIRSGWVSSGKIVGSCNNMDLLTVLLTDEDKMETFERWYPNAELILQN